MKFKFLLILLIPFVLSACVTSSSDLETRLVQLEAKVKEMEDLGIMGAAEGVGASFYPYSGGLTGGGTGALDKTTGTEDSDAGVVMLNDDATYGNAFMPFTLDADGGGTEEPPWLIDSGDGGNEDWELTDVYANDLYTKPADDPYIYFEPDTASESDWYVGVNHDSGGDDDDSLEWRQSATPGTSVEMELQTDGDLIVTGNLTVTGVINADIPVSAQTGATHAVSTDDSGTLFLNGDNDVIEFDLPANASQVVVCFGNDQDSSAVITIDPDASDYIVLDGTTASAGEAIVSGGNTKDHICLIGLDNSYWKVTGSIGSWAEETP